MRHKKTLSHIAFNNPMSIDEGYLLTHLKEILEEKPLILQKLLLVFLHKREELYKKWVNKDPDSLLFCRHGVSPPHGNRLLAHQSPPA